MTRMKSGGAKVLRKKPMKLSFLVKILSTLMSSNTGEFLMKSKRAFLAHGRSGQEYHDYDDHELPHELRKHEFVLMDAVGPVYIQDIDKRLDPYSVLVIGLTEVDAFVDRPFAL